MVSLLLAFTLSLSILMWIEPAEAAQNYCQFGTRTNLIFVDRTTAYDDVDKSIFASGFGSIVERLQTGDRVVVYTIGGDYVDSERAFDQCVPGCPDKGMLDWLFAECRALEARADLTKFKRDLAQNIRQMLDDIQEYPHSDIARTIAFITNEKSQGYNQGAYSLSSVFVFSDLLENSKELPWPSIVRLPAKGFIQRLNARNVVADMSGASVYAFGVGRLHDKNRSPLPSDVEFKVKEFWTLFFQEAGASTVFIGRRLN